MQVFSENLKIVMNKFEEPKRTYLFFLSSKIEKAHLAEKTTTTRCGIRETATTRNVVLWLFLNNHDAG